MQGIESHSVDSAAMPSNFGLLCGFSLADREFRVVRVNQIETVKGKFPDADEADYEELCRFDVNGEQCAIFHRSIRTDHTSNEAINMLSARELQIATLVAQGCPNKQIAHKLHISEFTVASYLRRIFAKLGVESRAAMAFRCASLIGRTRIV
jgi:DNA-binding CsgD family transcriptional regulator